MSEVTVASVVTTASAVTAVDTPQLSCEGDIDLTRGVLTVRCTTDDEPDDNFCSLDGSFFQCELSIIPRV